METNCYSDEVLGNGFALVGAGVLAELLRVRG